MLLFGMKEVSRVSGRENPISVRSKRRITKALLELMEVTPFPKISIKDIVDRAGLTRQTFYHNYETKEEVLLYQLDDYMDEFVHYLSRKKVGNWEDVICCFFRFWQERADFLRLLMKNDLTHLLTGRMVHYFTSVKAFHFDKTDLTDAEARLWFSFVSGALVNTLTSWLSSTGGISARTLSKMVLSMMDGTMMERNESADTFDVGKIIDLLSADTSKDRNG